MKIDRMISNNVEISNENEAELFFDIEKNTLCVKMIDGIYEVSKDEDLPIAYEHLKNVLLNENNLSKIYPGQVALLFKDDIDSNQRTQPIQIRGANAFLLSDGAIYTDVNGSDVLDHTWIDNISEEMNGYRYVIYFYEINEINDDINLNEHSSMYFDDEFEKEYYEYVIIKNLTINTERYSLLEGMASDNLTIELIDFSCNCDEELFDILIYTPCKNLTLIGMDFSNKTSLNNYLSNDDFETIKFRNVLTNTIIDFSEMFYGNEDLSSLSSLNTFDTSNGENFSYMFFLTALKTIPLLNTSNGKNFDGFVKSTPITRFPLIDTSNGINFECMFSGCENLKEIPQLDTSNGENFSYMFEFTTELKTIPNLDFSKGKTFEGMFYRSEGITNPPILNLLNAETCEYMFEDCVNLEEARFSGLSKCTSFNCMFSGCSKLKTVTFENSTSNVSDFSWMFYEAGIEEINGLDTSNGEDFSRMFYYCTNLKKLPLMDLSKAWNVDAMFKGTTELTDVAGFSGLWTSLDLSSCEKLTHESLMNIINLIAEIHTSDSVLTLGEINLAKLSDEEKLIAINKGWSLK
jgi:hypothetical protein